MVGTVTDATFESEVLKSNKPVLVDFWAEWCPPCRQIAPVLEELSKDVGETAKILKMNVDENSTIPMQYGIRSIPTLLVFKDGKMVAQQVGAIPKSKMLAMLG